MKKYVIPVTEVICSETEGGLCKDSGGKRYGQWGAGPGDGSDPYANDDWNNEGHNNPTDPIEDDYGQIDAQGKAWGDLWDDVIW